MINWIKNCFSVFEKAVKDYGLCTFMAIATSLLIRHWTHWTGWSNISECTFIFCVALVFYVWLWRLYKKVIEITIKRKRDKIEIADIKFKLLNSTVYVKRGIAEMFYATNHCFESHIDDAAWMKDLYERGIINVTKKEQVWSASFEPKILNVLENEDFEKAYFEDFQDVKLLRQNKNDRIKRVSKTTFEAIQNAMSHGKKLVVLLALILFTISCAPTIEMQRLNNQQYLAKPSDAPITVFYTKAPKCPYDEIGVVKATEGDLAGGRNTFIEAMKNKAREVGGDALLLNQVTSSNAGYVAFTPGLIAPLDVESQSATIIRFKNTDCME
jgi:hypothetical protein